MLRRDRLLVLALALELLAGCRADADPCGPGRACLPGEARRRAEQLISLFENGTIEIQYDEVEVLDDGRGVTAGRAGFTSATGDLLEVVERYAAEVPANPLVPFLPRLRELADAGSGETAGLGGLAEAWAEASQDPAFRGIQDQVMEELYYLPAMKHARDLEARWSLSRAALYDAAIQHGDGSDPDGLPALLVRAAQVAGGTPSTGVAEPVWLRAFLGARRADLLAPSDAETRTAWAASVPRVDVWLWLLDQGNSGLAGPIVLDTPEYEVTIP